jgi:hypothetical protein
MTMTTVQATNRSIEVGSAAAGEPSAATATAGADAGSMLLPEPSACGLGDGAITQLAMILTKADEQDRSLARHVQQTADQAAMQEAHERVQQIRTKADDEWGAALSSGIGDIVGGACTLLGAGIGSGSGAQAPAAADGGCTTAAVDARFDWSAAFSGFSKVASASGTIVSGGYKAAADRDDAEATRHDAQSQADVRRYDEAHADVQAAEESIQKVRQFLDQVVQAQNEARSVATTFRA